ncbi:neutral zinc metallopeptidase [Synechocystis sp. LKSZ1]|uniref:neutral zinc metallopeptidase n=1 Tax=Synechocystis sp. LKSZ1 TaxID=3144951 RepID=UPI00336BCE1C
MVGIANLPAWGAWNYQTLKQVEQQLNQFLAALPQGETVQPPRVFVYEGTAVSPCGPIETPAYCPGDHTVYLELKLLNAANQALGDYAAYVVLAHEYGHAYITQMNQHPEGKAGELKADEFAGVFTRYAQEKNLLEEGDVEEALKLTFAVGDHNYWDKGHHGTPEERAQAFRQGFTGSSQTFAFRGTQDNSGTRQEPPDVPVTSPTPVPPNSAPAPTHRSFSAGLFVIPFLLLIVPLIGLGIYQLLKDDDV